MILLYNLFLKLYVFGVRISALAGNYKAQQWIEGRNNWRKKIPADVKGCIWFHCASTGEFEQGRPIMERLKQTHPQLKIVLTFFSPSGFSVQKNYSSVDYVCYLPMDSSKNAKDFVTLLRPKAAVFIKYDYWYYYLKTLNANEIPVFVASAIFRNDQRFFKRQGNFFRKILRYVTFFFVQNEVSAQLLSSIGLKNYNITGDTRFDRVIQISKNPKQVEKVEQFVSNSNMTIVCGSTWQEDEKLLVSAIKEFTNYDQGLTIKFIIVPHEINHHHIGQLEYSLIENADLKPDDISIYTHDHENVSVSRVLIVDTVGLLSSLYRYGFIAYVGGGFGKGIHNILEAAVYGRPVLFGPGYKKFAEAEEMIGMKAAFTVSNQSELINKLKFLIADQQELKKASETARNYVLQNAGATEKVVEHLILENSVLGADR